MTDYVHYAHRVRVTKDPDARGMHRIRFFKADGRPGEARRASWDDAHRLALEAERNALLAEVEQLRLARQQTGSGPDTDPPV